MTDSEAASALPGLAKTGEAEIVTLKGSQHRLYLSGIKRGHAEALEESASNISGAASAYAQGLRTQIVEAKLEGDAAKWANQAVSVAEAFEKIAGQIRDQIQPAKIEANKLLSRGLGMKIVEDQLTVRRPWFIVRLFRALRSAW